MSEYSRHTTTKGQLLLNIKPPSISRTPQPQPQQQLSAIPPQNNTRVNTMYGQYNVGGGVGYKNDGQGYGGQNVGL